MDWDQSYQIVWPFTSLRGFGPWTSGPMSHCLLGSVLGPVADSPGAEGWTGLAGQAEATLRGKAECMASGSQRVLDITAGLQVQIALLLPAGVKEREAVF